MRFSINRTVSPHDLDYNNVASPSAILRFLQEAAYVHMMTCPPSMDDLRKENKVFLISKVAYCIYKPLYACDEIKITTWACEGKAASFPRYTKIERGDELIAEMNTICALLNPVEGKLWKVEDYHQTYTCEENVEISAPTKFRIPREIELNKVGEYKISYNDCDLNRHINNTHYPDIICGFLPNMNGKMIKKISISYLHEGPLNEKIDVYLNEYESDKFMVRTIREDGSINIEALIELGDI